jgi:hypothetical protein
MISLWFSYHVLYVFSMISYGFPMIFRVLKRFSSYSWAPMYRSCASVMYGWAGTFTTGGRDPAVSAVHLPSGYLTYGKSILHGGVHGKIICKWVIFHS